jgi:beta-lactamase regulating signal transducer with metallopeptidase domain
MFWFVLAHVGPSLYDSIAIFVLLVLAFKVFRVKHPATRYAFLLLVLLKPFLILLDGTAEVRHKSGDPFQFGMRMPDPFGLIRSPLKEIGTASYDFSFAAIIILAITGVIFLLMMARWLQLFLFFNRLKSMQPLSKESHPEVYGILDELVEKFRVCTPRIVLIDDGSFVPFSVGSRAPVIALSQDLLDKFPQEQLRIMLAHELAHVKRRDGAYGWLTIILRDLMFLNPMVHLAYRMLEEEKEKACDLMVLEKTTASAKEIANTLLDVVLFYKNRESSQGGAQLLLARGFIMRKRTLEKRIEYIISATKPAKPRPGVRALKALLFVVLLYLQVGFGIIIGGHVIFLR